MFGGRFDNKSALHHNCRGNSEVYIEEVDFMRTAIFACVSSVCGGFRRQNICVSFTFHSFSEFGRQTSLARLIKVAEAQNFAGKKRNYQRHLDKPARLRFVFVFVKLNQNNYKY